MKAATPSRLVLVMAFSVMTPACTREKTQDLTAQGPAPPDLPLANERDGLAAAEAWLSLVDARNYSQSWTDAAAYFKRAVDEPAWEKAITTARSPLGKVRSRALKSATYATTLPGAPDGDYVVVLFDTVFEKKERAVETVTPMKEADGRWRVSGYFIK